MSDAVDAIPRSDWAKCCDLISRRKQFAAADMPSLRQRITDISGGRSSFAITDSGRFIGYNEAHFRISRIDLRFVSWNCEAKCETATFRTPSHHVVLHMPLRGEFEAGKDDDWIRVRPGDALVVNTPGWVRRRWEGRCDSVRLRIEREVANFADFKSTKGNPPLALIDFGQSVALARFIETLILDLSSDHPVLSDGPAAMHAERILSLLLLQSLRKQCGQAITSRPMAVPYYVRRAEQYLAKNYMTPITIEETAAATGVSLRTLYYGFKRHRGESPRKYLKGLRLLHARRTLLEAPLDTRRIGDIAMAVGYENKSQFTRDYREYFGETPTATACGIE
jgi:AraC-like DNA-binding protein